MAPTPSKSNQGLHPKTPQSKHRLNFNVAKPSPNPNSAVKEAPPAEHPVEVVGRIRDYPDRKEKSVSALQMNPDRHSLRVKTEIGYRDFTLDGVSLSEEEDLDSFYKKFVGSRISGVKLGDKCTVMMYGPTGSGKSHTMFGCPKQPGIVYRSLKEILGERDGDGDEGFGIGTFVQVTVLEIYNEEIYDLLSTNSGGGLSFGWPKGSASKVRLEVMGKKAKNATFISGTEAAKISKEIQKVEKRRIVRSTLCNERSSRSHCMIILDVPTVGGRLMLVDMAGSENIEQAGQNTLEAKMQTGKINQGNIALKRVVESIANGDSHVPFRDSKLTMLLQDSFEDDKSKILMILCASPDPKEMHKTISTLEYGAKAKCIVRGPHTPIKDRNGSEDPSSAMMGSRIAAMDQFIFKLQMENKQREKERNEAHKALMKKEEEVSALREKLSQVEGSEEEINLKVNERVQMLKSDLEKKVRECERMAHEFVELERRKMEETIKQQQQEVEMLRRRLEETELELVRSRGGDKRPSEVDGSSFAKKLLEAYADEDPGMVKSMDLDRSVDFDSVRHEASYPENSSLPLWNPASLNLQAADNNNETFVPLGTENLRLSTVFEEAEEEQEKSEDEEVQKEVIEEKTVYSIPSNNFSSEPFASSPRKLSATLEHDYLRDGPVENDKDLDSNRRKRIQTIFTLCGNYRELSGTPNPLKVFETVAKEDSTVKRSLNKVSSDSKENYDVSEAKTVGGGGGGDLVDVHVKWEASKDQPGKAITSFKVEKGATLADLRKLIEKQVVSDKQGFNFLTFGDSNESPVSREKEAAMQASNLPMCNQLKGYLASLRPVKGGGFQVANNPHHNLPLSPLQNILNVTAAR